MTANQISVMLMAEMKNKILIILLSMLLQGCLLHFDVYDLPFPKTIGDMHQVQTTTVSKIERK